MVILGRKYRIVKVEAFVSEHHYYRGLRVTLSPFRGEDEIVLLWTKGLAGRLSKVGAFQAALGDKQEEWTGRAIRFVAWGTRKYEIEEVK